MADFSASGTHQEERYDYIVVGLGAIGAASLYWLSRRTGKRVLGLEQYELGHPYGSSSDVSRIMRKQYNSIIYSRLIEDAYQAWTELEKESGMQLVHTTGAVYMGRSGTFGGSKVHEMIDATRQQGIPHEIWDGRELRRRYPQFHCEDDTIAIYQRDGGLVDAALAVPLHIQMARGRGAQVREKCTVQKLVPRPDGTMQVISTCGVFRCRHVIVATGPWINQLLTPLNAHIPVVVNQDQITYFGTPHTKLFTKDKFLSFVYFDGPDYYYSAPIHGNTGFKIGLEMAGPVMDPATRTLEVSHPVEQYCADLLRKLVPKALGPILYTKPCLNIMTYDWDFVIDTLAARGLPQVSVCIGAGHSFKFSALIGKILSQLAVDGRTEYDIQAFRFDRPAITDPHYKPVYHAAKKMVNPRACKPSKL